MMVLILVISDAFLTIGAFFGAFFLRNKGFFRIFLDEVQPLDVYLGALPIAVILLLITLSVFKAYTPKRRLRQISELYMISYAITFWMLLLMSASYLAMVDYSRIIVVTFWLFTLILVNVGRSVIRKIQASAIRRGKGVRRVVIVGAGRIGRNIAEKLSHYRPVGIKVVGFIDDDVRPRSDVDILGGIRDLENVINTHSIDEVYFAHQNISHENVLDTISAIRVQNVRYRVVSSIFELLTGTININEVEEIPSLDVNRTPSLVSRITKRVFDLIVAGILLTILTPLMLIIILIIRIDSPGRALFAHERIGFRGISFILLKFRTMHQDVNPQEMCPTQPDDKRVTKIGSWLRRTSLDELPQLINVIRGDMSLVGPRPEMPFIVGQYSRWQRKRLDAKPGLTGLWQILGRKDLPLLDNIEYDFYYINNQSLLLDIIILLKTIPLIIFGRGAY